MPENPLASPLSQDIQGVEREYKKNIALLNARPRITAALFIVWSAILAGALFFFLASVGWYGVQGFFEDTAYENALLTNATQTHAHTSAAAPQDLIVGNVQSVASGSGGMYDLYAEVENPNPRHAVEFSYTFSSAEGDVASQEGFLNPGETAYILAAHASSGKPKNATINLADISWIYLSAHDVANIATWYSDRSAFSVDHVVFAQDITYADTHVSRATFSLTNHTAYSYWEPSFTVRILRGALTLGIAEITAARFKAGEERIIDLRFFGDLPQTATVSVTPHIPYYDQNAYMDPEDSSSDDVRSRWTPEGR